MVEEKKFTGELVIIVLISVLLFGIVSSSFSIGDPKYSIDKDYGPGENLRGWLNMSFDHENSSSLFYTSTGDSIKLIDLLNITNNDYGCIPTDCNSGYETSTPSISKTFSLAQNNSVLYGLKISGGPEDLMSVSDFQIKISSNAPQSSSPQLYVDVLNDGTVDYVPDYSSGTFKNSNYGCYQNSEKEDYAKIYNEPKYCERINLSSSPEIKLGAILNKDSSAGTDVDFILSISDEDYSIIEQCTAQPTLISNTKDFPIASAVIDSSTYYKAECIPEDFSVSNTGNYYVCVQTSSSSDNSKYVIGWERNTPCGYSGYYGDRYTIDFDIYAREAYFGSLKGNQIVINETTSPGINIMIYDYIQEKYDGVCLDGCVIPIKFTSGAYQDISLSNARLSYLTDISVDTDKIYDISESPALISTENYTILNLDNANLSVPNSYGDRTFKLYFNDETVLTERLNIEKVPKINSISPIKTSAGIDTLFSAYVDTAVSGTPISKYEWDFGDNFTSTTTSKNITHIYNKTGVYNLKLDVEDEKGLSSSKTFEINVTSPKDWIKKRIDELKNNLKSYSSSINEFDSYTKNLLHEKFDSDKASSKLSGFESDFNRANSDESYLIIAKEIQNLNLPQSIKINAKGDKLSFLPIKNVINPQILQSIEGLNYSSSQEEDYIESIRQWNKDNLDTKITFKYLSAKYENYDENLFGIFSIESDEKTDITNHVYFIIYNPDDFSFEQGTNIRTNDNYGYIPIESFPFNIEFSTNQQIDFLELPVFIASPVENISFSDGNLDTNESTPDWKMPLYILIIIFVFLAGLAIYLTLQTWYKKKYESYLFKDRNDLYNLIHYIKNMKKRGLGNREISGNLKKSKWNSEQIRYVLKKYSGKRTGMAEIPVDKIIDKFERKSSRHSKRFHRY